MIKSHVSLVLLSVLALCSSPAVAWIPQAGLQIGAAMNIATGQYVALEGDLVTVAFRANPGDLIWVFAAALDKNGRRLLEHAHPALRQELRQREDLVRVGMVVPPASAGQSVS